MRTPLPTFAGEGDLRKEAMYEELPAPRKKR